ncbi:MAG: DNA polymerase III subunit epsilon [Alphaproteobacteria bacterium]|nr:DNA polymerase III subunit epsilon [Alphaproteobacteria bacterium]
MKREIVLDTETTGLDPVSGHRMVEIGCVELFGGIRTGKFFHSYLNPGREVPEEAFRVHGLSTSFLQDKPIFAEKVDAFLEFIADSPLVIHNAAFDMKFVNFELAQLGFPALHNGRVLDTLLMARRKFPGSPASLDALCKKFSIDLSGREKHGALLDAELLAEVYLELLGGRQVMMGLEDVSAPVAGPAASVIARASLEARSFPVSAEEEAAHKAMLASIKNPVWEEA